MTMAIIGWGPESKTCADGRQRFEHAASRKATGDSSGIAGQSKEDWVPVPSRHVTRERIALDIEAAELYFRKVELRDLE
jgi:hypothetical protein